MKLRPYRLVCFILFSLSLSLGLVRYVSAQEATIFRQLGMKTCYSALLLFYAYRRSDTPSWAKNIVIGVLGYLIAPFDMLPDLTPIIGYTDDLGILGFGLVI